MARPNILIFMTDDHGPWATRACGTPVIHSPSMDTVAEQGARFNRAFTPCPVCSPARASFFTGTLPSQHGIHDYLRYDQPIPGFNGIRDRTNIGGLLQRAGYQTAMIGKWHCGFCAQPHDGFDTWFSYAGSQYPHFGDMTFSDGGRHVQTHGHQSATLTDRALRFIDQCDDDQPFFLFVGYVDTHTPYKFHPPRLVEHYRNADLSSIPAEPYADCHGTPLVAWPDDPAECRENLAQYLAAVTFIDEHVGRVTDDLESRGLLDDTLVIYTSDHGHNNGHHGIHCKGNATTPQNFLDESIMVPSMMRWPRGFDGGQVRDEPIDHCDLFATLLDVAGADRGDVDSPGQSFLPLLRDETSEWRDAQFCEYGNARMIRTDRWKLIRRWPGPNGHFGDELYDLQNDPRETVNCIADHGGVVHDLSTRLEAHFARYAVNETSGLRVGEREPVNPNEPWRRDPQLRL